MNEWSPKEFYSGSLTTEQPPSTTIYRQYWEENRNQARGNFNLKNTMTGYKIKDYQLQPKARPAHFVEDQVGVLSCSSSKKKKNGISDPRFKRVINSEARDDTDSQTESRKTLKLEDERLTQGLEAEDEKSLMDKVISYLKAPNDVSLFESTKVGSLEIDKDMRRQGLPDMVTKDVSFVPPVKCRPDCNVSNDFNENAFDLGNFERYGDSEKMKINSSSNLKRSVSDCTLNRKNTLRDENEKEILNKVKFYPSATRVNRVHNWAKDYKLPPEKRRSVVTVIGQTQNKPFSKILNEINQRRKLAKELDKHALCKAIMESAENQLDVKNLIAKVDFVLPDGKIIYSTEKIYLRHENSKYKINKGSDECLKKSLELADANEKCRKRSEMIPEKDLSVSQIGKRSRLKRSGRRLGGATAIKEKDEISDFVPSSYTRLSCMKIGLFLLLLFLIFCSCVYYQKFRCSQSILFFDFVKPKNRAWYKKLLL